LTFLQDENFMWARAFKATATGNERANKMGAANPIRGCGERTPRRVGSAGVTAGRDACGAASCDVIGRRGRASLSR